MSLVTTLMILFWFVVPMIGCGGKAKEKGYSVLVGIIVGAVLGLFGLLIYLILPSSVTLQKKCPKCAEFVKAEANICKHCGSNFQTELSESTTQKLG